MMFRPSVELDRTECYNLLTTQTLGRLVFTQNALPDVLPALYHLDGESLLIGLVRGSPAAAASRGAIVAFEADHFDFVSGTGWSVTVVGQAREMTSETQPSMENSVTSWATDDKVVCLRVPADRMTGHRLVIKSVDAPSPQAS